MAEARHIRESSGESSDAYKRLIWGGDGRSAHEIDEATMEEEVGEEEMAAQESDDEDMERQIDARAEARQEAVARACERDMLDAQEVRRRHMVDSIVL